MTMSCLLSVVLVTVIRASTSPFPYAFLSYVLFLLCHFYVCNAKSTAPPKDNGKVELRIQSSSS